MRLCLLVLLWLVPVLGQASAPELVISVAPGSTPGEFPLPQLRATLASHLAGSGAHAVLVHVRPGAAELEVDGKVRTLTVSDWQSESIVWVIAVHVMDLATPEPGLRIAALAPPPARPAPRTALPIAFSLGPRLSRGVARTDTFSYQLELGADANVGPLSVGAAVGWAHVPTRGANTPEQFSADMWPLRIRLGLPWRQLALMGSVFMAPYRLRVDREVAGLSYGAGFEARWQGPRSGGLGWFVALGADAFARRATYGVERVAWSTPWFAPYLSAGIRYGAGA